MAEPRPLSTQKVYFTMFFRRIFSRSNPRYLKENTLVLHVPFRDGSYVAFTKQFAIT